MSEPLDLDVIEARANAATAGGWRVWSGTRPYDDEAAVETAWAYEGEEEVELVTDCCSIADAEFIAHSRTDVPTLIARVRELEPRVLEGDWETVRDVLDALPEGAQIRWRTGIEGGVALAIQRPSLLGIVAWQLTGYPGYISSEAIARDETPIEVIA